MGYYGSKEYVISDLLHRLRGAMSKAEIQKMEPKVKEAKHVFEARLEKLNKARKKFVETKQKMAEELNAMEKELQEAVKKTYPTLQLESDADYRYPHDGQGYHEAIRLVPNYRKIDEEIVSPRMNQLEMKLMVDKLGKNSDAIQELTKLLQQYGVMA